MCSYKIYDFKIDEEKDVEEAYFNYMIELHSKYGEIETENVGDEIWYYRKDTHRTYIGSKRYEKDS